MVVQMALGQRVLRLYRNIMRLSRSWTAALPAETESERVYIRDEARRLFKKNKELTDAEQIQSCIKEAEQRIEIAQHYRNPYPRHINLPQNTLPPGGKRKLKGREKAVDQAVPAYYQSYKDGKS